MSEERDPRPADGAPMTPTEPGSPVDTRAERSRAWLVGWALVGLLGLLGGVVAIAVDVRTEVQALALALAATAATVRLHHRVASHDTGELQIERDPRASEPLTEDRVERPLGRRPVLVRAGLGALAAVAGAVGLRWLGPRRPRDTAWQAGVAVVTDDGRRLRPDDLPPGVAVTGWPADAVDMESAAIMVLRLRDAPLPPTDPAGVVADRVVAYSRICTHAGCPVALFRTQDQALFCPCHQATFDARRAATPTFGPPSAPLPQLPLDVDVDGYLVARGPLAGPVGPRGGQA